MGLRNHLAEQGEAALAGRPNRFWAVSQHQGTTLAEHTIKTTPLDAILAYVNGLGPYGKDETPGSRWAKAQAEGWDLLEWQVG